MRARTLTTVTIGALALAACGSPADESGSAATAGTEAPAATEAPAETAAPEGTTTPEPTDAPPATESTDAPVATDAPAATDAPPATEATTAPTDPPAPTLPDDGCSADNSPTPTDVADGPRPTLEVRAESANSPLPDLAVRRINCAGGWVNLKNELPAAQPVLLWFYAPH